MNTTLKDKVTPAEVVDFLNELLRRDPGAMSALVRIQIECGQYIADHLTARASRLDDDSHCFSVLGILNGLFGLDDGWGQIVMVSQLSDNSYVLTEFRLLTEGDRESLKAEEGD